MKPVLDVPVSLIIGALGVGKTTAIRALLAQRPAAERWAIVVNEFGQVGIDGAVLDDGRAEVQEIAGGCVCCTSGAMFRTSLVRLLRERRPDRLIVEPTGLAHPASIVDTVRSLGEAVRLGAVIALVDPRRPVEVSDSLGADRFAMADVVVATRADQASEAELAAFRARAEARFPPPLVVAAVEHGQIDVSWLDLPHQAEPLTAKPRFVAVQGGLIGGRPGGHDEGPGPESRGWVFPAAQVFDRQRLTEALQAIVRPGPLSSKGVLRAKGLFRTPGAWLLIHADAERIAAEPSPWRRDSRVEIIVPEGSVADWEGVEAALKAAFRS